VLDPDAFEAFKEEGIFDPATARSWRKNIWSPAESRKPWSFINASGGRAENRAFLEKAGTGSGIGRQERCLRTIVIQSSTRDNMTRKVSGSSYEQGGQRAAVDCRKEKLAACVLRVRGGIIGGQEWA